MKTKTVAVIGLFLALAWGWPPYFSNTTFSDDVFENRPIEYGRSTPDNRISRLQRRIDRDEISLSFGADEHGYLSALLAAQFSAAGPRDHRGRSLRDFDLRTRMFRYPCSYLIYSAAFDGLPDRMKAYVAGKLLAVLEGRDDDAAYAHLSSADRRAVSQILHATKPELWKLTDDFEGVMP